MSAVHLWGPDVQSLGLDDDMEDIELGERVSFDLAMERFAVVYTFLTDRIKSMELLLTGRLAWPHQSQPQFDESTPSTR